MTDGERDIGRSKFGSWRVQLTEISRRAGGEERQPGAAAVDANITADESAKEKAGRHEEECSLNVENHQKHASSQRCGEK